MNLSTTHLFVAFAVALLAVFGAWQRNWRRITLYVVSLQIALGVALLLGGARVPWYHVALGVAGWGAYMVANVLSRREGGRRIALVVAAAASVLILIAYVVGIEALKHGSAGG